MTTNERVVVDGATGHLGMAVVEEFCARNTMDVIAVARKESFCVDRLRSLGASVVFADASDPEETYANAFANGGGVTTAISCLASRIKNVDWSSDFWAIDRDANIRFGRQALKSGVGHLVLVATFEGKESRHVSEFSNAKEEAVDVLENECRRSGATVTVVRPNAYFKDLTDQAFDSVLATGRHLVLGGGSHRINPIARKDVAAFIADCAQDQRGGEFPLGGPDTFTYREIGLLAAQAMGKQEEVKIRTVPLWLLRLGGLVLDIVGWIYLPARRNAALVHWMLYCSTHDAVAPCHGNSTLKEEYRRKFEEIKKQAHRAGSD